MWSLLRRWLRITLLPPGGDVAIQSLCVSLCVRVRVLVRVRYLSVCAGRELRVSLLHCRQQCPQREAYVLRNNKHRTFTTDSAPGFHLGYFRDPCLLKVTY